MAGAAGVELQTPAAGLQLQAPPAAGPETEHVCFVCMEPCEDESRCNCTDRYVHTECLLKWLRTKTATRCDVCLEEYPNVNLETKTSRRASSSCGGVLLGSVCFVAMLVGGSLQLSAYLSPDRAAANIALSCGIMMVGMSIVGLVACTACGLKLRREGCRPWVTTRRRRIVMRGA